MHQELALAKDAARAGGEVLRSRAADFGNLRLKASPTDLVTDADVQAGVAIAHAIKSQRPDARFVIEEEEVYELAGVEQGGLFDSEVWVVDPLDGTSSFVHGYPFYSVSIALLRSGTPVAGAVYHVPADEMFSAGARMGAFLDDQPIRCTEVSELRQALLVTGFPYDRGALFDRQHSIIARLMKLPIHGIRRDGSAALDLAQIASGRADGFWEFGLKPWDMAAGVLIGQEAGAHVTDIDGEPWTPRSTGVIAANPALHAALVSVIQGTP